MTQESDAGNAKARVECEIWATKSIVNTPGNSVAPGTSNVVDSNLYQSCIWGEAAKILVSATRTCTERFKGCIDNDGFTGIPPEVITGTNDDDGAGGGGQAGGGGSGGGGGGSPGGGSPGGGTKPKTETAKTDPKAKTDPATSQQQAPSNQQASQGGSQPTQQSATTGNSSTDLQTLSQAQSDAQRCCSNPASCAGQMGSQGQGGLSQLAALGTQMAMSGAMGGGMAGGLQAACQQMQSLGGAGGAANTGFAAICYAKKSNCEAMADQMISNYNSMGDTSTVSQLQQMKGVCVGLQNQLAALSAQGTTAGGAGGLGGLCSQMASAQTASLGMQPPQGSSVLCDPNVDNSNNPACVNCNLDPTNPICPQAAADAGSSGYKTSTDDAGGFNTPEMPNTADPGMQTASMDTYQSNPATVVPNNTGGGIPGNAAPAAGGGGGARGGGGGAGYNTDIMQGTMSGGYSSQAANMNMGTEGGAGFRGYGSGGESDASGYAGLDLKKFLPGGAKDPNRKLAGLGAGAQDIGPKFTNIFKRITERIQILCRYNRLLECEAQK